MRVILFILCALSLRAADITFADVEVYAPMATGSMRPTFDEKDMLLVKSLPFKDLRVGDIIIYHPTTKRPGLEGVPVVHRVVRKSSGGSVVICRGDSLADEDPDFIVESMYVGTVVAIWRGRG